MMPQAGASAEGRTWSRGRCWIGNRGHAGEDARRADALRSAPGVQPGSEARSAKATTTPTTKSTNRPSWLSWKRSALHLRRLLP
jgi:hypothetical protein